MKKISIVLLLIFILTGCIKSSDEGLYVFTGHKYIFVDYINNEYYLDNNSIYILNDNKFVEYRTEKDHKLFLYPESKRAYIGYPENGELKYVEYLGDYDDRYLDFLDYDITMMNCDIAYTEMYITYKKENIISIRIESMDKNKTNQYMIANPSLYYDDKNIYFYVFGYYPQHHTVMDMRINGEDYAGSELYKLDMENKQAVFIYRTGSDKAIVYGNEKAIYYADGLYDIYRIDLINDMEELVYDSISERRLEVDYEHGKLFIFEEDKSIGVIDVY